MLVIRRYFPKFDQALPRCLARPASAVARRA
jgi:hypothetical protein